MNERLAARPLTPSEEAALRFDLDVFSQHVPENKRPALYGEALRLLATLDAERDKHITHLADDTRAWEEEYDYVHTLDTALAELEEWRTGGRSYTNLGPYPPYTPDVIAAMDAQEVVKLSAYVQAHAALAPNAGLDAPDWWSTQEHFGADPTYPSAPDVGLDVERLQRAIDAVAIAHEHPACSAEDVLAAMGSVTDPCKTYGREDK